MENTVCGNLPDHEEWCSAFVYRLFFACLNGLDLLKNPGVLTDLIQIGLPL